MSTLIASAPAKLILCGEHAVVYGQPAIAVPVAALRAQVAASSLPAGAGLRIAAPDLSASWTLADQAPLAELLRRTLERLDAPTPDLELRITSAIPIAGGMGSGAAIATALLRALFGALGLERGPAEISALVYESERAFHGTPSGIDNTVVAYERPVWFQRQQEGPPLIETLRPGGRLLLAIGDTGTRSETRAVVGDLRQRWHADPAAYEPRFAAIGDISRAARAALEAGDAAALGPLLDHNHALLMDLDISSPELERLVGAARAAGALGAKLSGAGRGGVMLALARDAAHAEQIVAALRGAGAVRAFVTPLEAAE